MAHAQQVGIEEMRSRLLTLDDVTERLTETDPGAEHVFDPAAAAVRLEPGWGDGYAQGDLAGAYLRVARLDGEYQLTKKAMLDIGAACRLPRKLQMDWPADLLQDVVNRALAGELTNTKELKALERPGAGGTVLGVTRGTITPFRNVAILDSAVAGIRAFYGADTEILADYKFTNTPARTDVRLIVPGHQRVITGTRVPDDTWSVGVAFTNSLTATEPTGVNGYLFRFWCTNGCYDTAAHVEALNRRQVADPDEAYEWVRHSVDAVLGGLETSLDSVQELTSMPVAGDVRIVARGLFNEFSVPANERARIIGEMAELDGELTMYDFQQAATLAANADGLSPDTVHSLLSLGGQIAHVQRCDEIHPCRRPLPSDWVPELGTAPAPAN